MAQKTKSTKKESRENKKPDPLKSFVNTRKKPAIFLFLTESVQLAHVVRVRNALNGREFDELDLVINSFGGSIHAAYQIVELIRLHTKKLNACVPFYAKSAATLLCVASDKIIVDELAQLGPLDAQIREEKKGGKEEFTSALNPFKTLEQLQNFSLETLDLAVRMILKRSGLNTDDCLKHAIEFVRTTTGPLITQLDPEKLGECSRELSVGEEYAKRLLRRFHADWDEKKRNEVAENLVHKYPSHDYIIDYQELKEMGFDVELFNDDEAESMKRLFDLIASDKTIIECVEISEGEKNMGKNDVEEARGKE